jgi:hypothetical protein
VRLEAVGLSTVFGHEYFKPSNAIVDEDGKAKQVYRFRWSAVAHYRLCDCLAKLVVSNQPSHYSLDTPEPSRVLLTASMWVYYGYMFVTTVILILILI